MRAHILTALAMLLVTISVGCSGPAAPPAKGKEHDDHGHAHPSKGPNGGDLIELGDEEYHAEIVINEKTDEVSIYILDKTAKVATPIESAELVINLKHDGKPEQHKLAAAPLAGEQGKSSRFVSKDPELHHDLEGKGADPRLQVTIAGKAFSGKVSHEHEGEGHDHDHKK